MSEKPQPILAAEDDESEQMILELAFRRASVSRPVVFVRDGQEAVDYLTGAGRYIDRSAHPLPALLVLDLKMPRMSGFDVLAWLATQPALVRLPAVMLSSSEDPSDMRKARELGAREYFVKPHRFETLIEVVRDLEVRWAGNKACVAEAPGSLGP